MRSGGFRADPEALSQLARKYEQIADQLAQEIAVFSRSSRGVRPEAFGLLPAARTAGHAYLQKSDQAVSGLKAIQDTVHDLAGGLRTTTVNYVAADDDSIPGLP